MCVFNKLQEQRDARVRATAHGSDRRCARSATCKKLSDAVTRIIPEE